MQAGSRWCRQLSSAPRSVQQRTVRRACPASTAHARAFASCACAALPGRTNGQQPQWLPSQPPSCAPTQRSAAQQRGNASRGAHVRACARQRKARRTGDTDAAQEPQAQDIELGSDGQWRAPASADGEDKADEGADNGNSEESAEFVEAQASQPQDMELGSDGQWHAPGSAGSENGADAEADGDAEEEESTEFLEARSMFPFLFDKVDDESAVAAGSDDEGDEPGEEYEDESIYDRSVRCWHRCRLNSDVLRVARLCGRACVSSAMLAHCSNAELTLAASWYFAAQPCVC